MANRFWVGGSGTWDTTSTTNWSATTGGAAGASAPTSADVAIFDANSGAVTVTLGENVTAFAMTYSAFTGTFAFSTYKITLVGDGNVLLGAALYTATGSKQVDLTYAGANARSCFVGSNVAEANAFNINVLAGTGSITVPTNGARVVNLDFTGFSGTWASTGSQNIAGNLTLSATMTDVSTHTLSFSGSTTQTIRTNGVVINRGVQFTNTNTKVLADNFTTVASNLTTLSQGVLDATDKNVTIGVLSTSNSNAREIRFGSGTWTVAGSGATAWNCATSTNLTVSYTSGASIDMTSASAKTFAGGSKSWPTLNQGGAGALTISGSNTFANITNTVQPATITLTSGTTQTVTEFDVSGTSGNLITLRASTPGSAATLSDTTGTNSVSYVSITDITATGGATWEAYTSNGNVDGGGNTGWLFAEIPTASGNTIVYDLRSFTEKRRF
jgi:hypothetical protein